MSSHQRRGRKRLTDRERYSCGQVRPATATSVAEWQTHLPNRTSGALTLVFGLNRIWRAPSSDFVARASRKTACARRSIELSVDPADLFPRGDLNSGQGHYEAEVDALSRLTYRGLRHELELLCVRDELPNAGVMPLVKQALSALGGPLGVRHAMARQKSGKRRERDQ
jgi:hypothetical protein